MNWEVRRKIVYLKHRIGFLLLDTDTGPLEGICSIIMIGIGFLLAAPGSTLAQFATYRLLESFIPNEETAGILLALVGIIAFTGILFDINPLRAYMAGIKAGIFAILSLSMLTSAPPSFGLIVNSVLAISEIWIAFRKATGE